MARDYIIVSAYAAHSPNSTWEGQDVDAFDEIYQTLSENLCFDPCSKNIVVRARPNRPSVAAGISFPLRSARSVNALDLDTSLVTALREHLLGLAHQSLPPVHGGPPAQQGSPEEDAVMTRFRPFAELLVLVAAADGRIDDIERAVILGAFRALTGRRVRGATLEALETELRERFHETDPLDALERVCASLAGDRRDAELALQLAGAVAMADLKADPSELELIGTLASWLSIPTRRLGEILSGPSSSE